MTEGLHLDDRYERDARLFALRRWHKTYVALDLPKVTLGLATLGQWV